MLRAYEKPDELSRAELLSAAIGAGLLFTVILLAWVLS